jgi:hypothetical protein
MRQGSDRKASRYRCRDSGHAAAEKDFDPAVAGAVKGADGDVADAARGRKRRQPQRFALTVLERRCCKPTEPLLGQNLTVAAIIFPANNCRIEHTAIEGIQQTPG